MNSFVESEFLIERSLVLRPRSAAWSCPDPRPHAPLFDRELAHASPTAEIMALIGTRIQVAQQRDGTTVGVRTDLVVDDRTGLVAEKKTMVAEVPLQGGGTALVAGEQIRAVGPLPAVCVKGNPLAAEGCRCWSICCSKMGTLGLTWNIFSGCNF